MKNAALNIFLSLSSLALVPFFACAASADAAGKTLSSEGSADSQVSIQEPTSVEAMAIQDEEEAFLEKVQDGTARRLALGDGVTLDLIQVGYGSCAYFIGRYEITQEQYRLVMGENPSAYRKEDQDKHPVDSVSWQDAMTFCSRLKSFRPADMDGFTFTLPTNAQWDKAAYGGEACTYAGGEDLASFGWFQMNSKGQTHAVGMKRPNAFGIFDMSGNVWEWCREEKNGYRAIRGGSYDNPFYCCTMFFHFKDRPCYLVETVGFRVAAVR